MKGRKARLLLIQVSCVIFLISFSLLFRVEQQAIPAFTNQEFFDEGDKINTPSVFDFLWQHRDLPKYVLRSGFSLLTYVEQLRQDSHVPGLSAQVTGWFLGFDLRHPRDMLVNYFPKSTATDLFAMSKYDKEHVESDWGISPVLFSLPPGENGKPVSIPLGTDPMVAIYHTHATESYLPEIGKTRDVDAFTDDLSKSVVKVGEMLASVLETRYRIPTLHSRTVHDNNARLGAYYRSESTVKAIMQKYSDCRVYIDVHRDSQRRDLTAVSINGKTYARMMLVIGTNNPNWISNYNFARQIVSVLEEAYPGITRSILYASAVYNQSYSPYMVLVEVGGVDNTLAECKNSMEALAWAISKCVFSMALPPP